MSTTNENNEKIILPRTYDEFWETIQAEWAGEDRMLWKYLAILHLRVHCGWKLEMISLAFGHPKGHVSRILKATIGRLRGKFAAPWDEWERLAEDH